MAGQAFLVPQRLGVAGHVEQRAAECAASGDENPGFIHHRVGCVDPNGLAPWRRPHLFAIGRVDDGQPGI
jgi:hypothetical protein